MLHALETQWTIIFRPGFYLSFWQMSLYDISWPKEKYDEVLKMLNGYKDGLKSRHGLVQSEQRRKLDEHYENVINAVKDEKEDQRAVSEFTTGNGGRLDQEKLHWFSHGELSGISYANHRFLTPLSVSIGKGTSFIQSLIEHCIQPRCLLSPMDAIYSSKFIRIMHERGTPGFHTLMCYNQV